MADPRGVEERLDWFLSHNPSGPGMCAAHTWHALGGDMGNPPAWGCADANQCVDKVKKSGRAFTDGIPPRGAWVGWKYGNNGHAALSNGDGTITTTDPSNGKPTGIEPLDYPRRWGYTGSSDYTVWSDEYNGVRFDVGGGIEHGPVYLSKLVHGQQDSDSVRRLQLHLNAHPLTGGEQLPVTGNYADQTDEEVRLCQTQHGFGSDPAGSSSVGPAQAAHLFTNCGCVVHDDSGEEPPPVPSDDRYFYSGKPAGTFTFGADYKKLDLPAWAPSKDGLILGMVYLNVDGAGEFRVRVIRDPDDASAYLTAYPKSGDNFLLTHCWFEMAEAGRKLWWEVQSMDGETMNIGTRYCKWTLIG